MAADSVKCHPAWIVIVAGSFTELFEDVSSEEVGKAVRGDWFVTRLVSRSY